LPGLPDCAAGDLRARAALCEVRHADAGSGERSRAGNCRAGNLMNTQPRLVQVRQQVLKQNDLTARALRQRFEEAGVFVVSLVSSPGAGKTAFLERLLTRMRAEHRVAALVGDLATDNDAQRLARAQVP